MGVKLVPGESAKVVVRLQQYLYKPWYPNAPQFEVYEGLVQASTTYDGEDTIRMSARIPQGVRVVALQNVVSINGVPYSHPKKLVNKNRTFNVAGSKPGVVYEVMLDVMAKWHCPCKGFGFRGNCSHIDQVRAYLENEK